MKIELYTVGCQHLGDFTLPSPLILPLESGVYLVWQGAKI